MFPLTDLGEKVEVRYTDEDGEEKVKTGQEKVPEDISNGLILTLVKNIPASAEETVVSMLVATPDPQLVKLKIHAAGEETFSAAGRQHKATLYTVKVDIGGIKGVLAKLLGKQPPDSHVWVAQGDSPGFVKAERPFYAGAPLWKIELASPIFKTGQSNGGGS